MTAVALVGVPTGVAHLGKNHRMTDVPADPPAASEATSTRRVHTGALALVGILTAAVISTVVLVAMNPATVTAQATTNPNELLEDASFDLAPNLSAWQPVPASASTTYREVSGDGAIDGSGHGMVRGTVRQDVPLPPVDGRSYRAVVAVRGSGGQGVLRVQTACAAGEERAETRFTATETWRAVSATLTPKHGAQCSLRVELASLDGSPISVDRGSFVDANLANPSFEQGGTGWSAMAGASVATVAEGTAFDGGAVARLTSSGPGGALVQDVLLDRSSEPILASAEVAVRSAAGPVTVELQLRQPCSDERVMVSASVDRTWTPLIVAMRRTPATTAGGVPPDAPSLIRPTGDPCSVGVSVVLRTPGTIEVDGALLSLRSYNPSSGSRAYKAQLGVKRLEGTDGDSVDTTIADSAAVVKDRDAARRAGAP